MTSFKRTTILLTQTQIDGLKETAKADPDGLAVAQLIRIFINDGLARRKRTAKK